MAETVAVVLVVMVLVALAVGQVLRRRDLEAGKAQLQAALAEALDAKTALEVAVRDAQERAEAGLARAQAEPPPKPVCGTCIHWDLSDGQDAMRQNLAFTSAAAVLSPHQMGRTAQYDDGGQAIPRRDGKRGLKATWNDLGACHLRNEGTFQQFTCPNWHHEAAPVPEDGFPEPTPLAEPEQPAQTVPTAVILQRMHAERMTSGMVAVAAEPAAPAPHGPCTSCGETGRELTDTAVGVICEECGGKRLAPATVPEHPVN
jgi:hypothetical protein